MFLYSAVSPYRPVPFKQHLDFFGKHPAMLQLMHEYCLYTYIHHCLQPGIHSYISVYLINIERIDLAKIQRGGAGYLDGECNAPSLWMILNILCILSNRGSAILQSD